MSRPTIRATAREHGQRGPYTRTEIKEAVWNHFIAEGNNKCVSDRTGGGIYGQTGCAVGCMMTQADADFVDGMYIGTVGTLHEMLRGVYLSYFKESDKDFLVALQVWHDNTADGMRSRDNVVRLRQVFEKFPDSDETK